MSDIRLLRPHSLPPAEARAVVDRLAADLQRKFDLEPHWDGQVLHLRRSGVTAEVVLEEGQIRVEASLGLFMRAFRAAVEQEITRKLEQLFPSAG